MSRIGPLYDLQQIDTGLDRRVSRMRQIDSLISGSAELDAARAAHAEAEAQHKEAHARLKKIAHEAEDTSTRLRTNEKRLYDGSIKNPKELGQIQEEFGHLKHRHQEQEEQILEAMLLVEESEAALAERAAALEATEQEWEKYRTGLIEEKDTLLAQARVLQVKRQRAITDLPWADLEAYERLRRSKAGVAVAAVRDGLCGGCHIVVTANILRRARSADEIAHCPTCGRMLFPVGEVKYGEFSHELDNVDK